MTALTNVWHVGWPGFVIAGVFLATAYIVARRKGTFTYLDWCAVVLCWLFVAIVLRIMGFGN